MALGRDRAGVPLGIQRAQIASPGQLACAMFLGMDRVGGLFDFPEQDSPKWLPYALLLSITFALYGMTVYFQFVSDDGMYVTENYRAHGFTWEHLKELWTYPYLGHYAPMHNSVLALLYSLSGHNPFGFHVGQLLLHAACVCLLYFVLGRMEARRVALLASLIFAVHPTNIETVAWVSETKSTLAFLFFLLSLLFFIRQREGGGWRDGVVCVVFLILSLLSKINTVVAPAIFLLYDYRQTGSLRGLKWRTHAVYFLLGVLATAMHLMAYHQSANGLESAYFVSPWVHLLNFPFYILFYLQMALVPYPVSFAHSFRLYLGWSWETGAGWLGLMALLWVLYRSSRQMQFWVLWFLIFLGPVLQLIPNPVWVADRYLYVPLVGSSVLLSELFFRIKDRLERGWPRWGCEAAMTGVLVAYGGYTVEHLPVWRSDLAIWQDAIRWCEGSAFCQYNYGESLLGEWRLQQGGDELVKAVQTEPAPMYLTALGDALTFSARDYPAAIGMYQDALRRSAGMSKPAIADIYARLARAYIRAGAFEDARRAMQEAWNRDRSNPRLWVVNGFLEWRLGNLDAARSSLQRLLDMTEQGSEVAGLLTFYWGDAADVGNLLAELRGLGPRLAGSSTPRAE
jgi:protein O-mannosyl-transferase